MNKFSILKGIVLFSMLFAFVGEASAQAKRLPGPRVNKPAGPPPGATPPGAEIIAKHGKWQVQCTDIPTGPPQQQAAAQGGGSGGLDVDLAVQLELHGVQAVTVMPSATAVRAISRAVCISGAPSSIPGSMWQ